MVAEVWPTLFGPVGNGALVKDAVQVRDTALTLRDADRSGALRTWLAPELTDDVAVRVVSEEGWVLGAAEGDLRP